MFDPPPGGPTRWPLPCHLWLSLSQCCFQYSSGGAGCAPVLPSSESSLHSPSCHAMVLARVAPAPGPGVSTKAGEVAPAAGGCPCCCEVAPAAGGRCEVATAAGGRCEVAPAAAGRCGLGLGLVSLAHERSGLGLTLHQSGLVDIDLALERSADARLAPCACRVCGAEEPWPELAPCVRSVCGA